MADYEEGKRAGAHPLLVVLIVIGALWLLLALYVPSPKDKQGTVPVNPEKAPSLMVAESDTSPIMFTVKATLPDVNAVSLVVPPQATDSQVAGLLKRLRASRLSNTLGEHIPPTTPGHKLGAHAVAEIYVFSESAYAGAEAVRVLARGATAQDALGSPPQILDQHDAERDCDGPQFADGEGLDLLVRPHEAHQRVWFKVAVGVGNECPGDTEHARVAGERTGCELRQLAIVTGRQVLPDFTNLGFHQMIVVQQPLGRRSNRPVFIDGARDGAISAEQHHFVGTEAHPERPAACRLQRDQLGCRQAGRMFLESLDAEELVPHQALVVPGRSGCESREPATTEKSRSGSARPILFQAGDLEVVVRSFEF